ncbi:MAG TPA: ribosome biogenesis factor YjgA [Burkholderiales bacterium]|nr:ribosome biogenesis factor YjgA [Burkholderiales bacterium]
MIPACRFRTPRTIAPVEEEVQPSRTKRKQDDLALQDLGEALVAVSEEKLAELDLPERLRDAVTQARAISRFGALRRQMQYIGRLMREEGDADTIRARLDAWNGVSVEETARLHLIERWRVRLLNDEKALEALIAEHPGADVQKLRTLMRNTKREKEAGKPPKSFRELFQVLRETLNSQHD